MLWILAAILLLVILLCLLRIHITAEFNPSAILTLRIGPVRKQLYPVQGKTKKEKKTAAASAKKSDKSSQGKKERRSIPKPGFSDLRDAYETLKPALFRALRRTRRGIRMDPLELSVVFGGREDPAGAAERFGYANAVVWSVMPALERLVKIPDPGIHLDMDFEAEKLRVTGSLGIDIRIGTVLLVAFGLAVPALRWLWKYSKEKDTENRQPVQASAV